MSKEEAENIIDLIPSVDIIHADDKLLEGEYKKLLHKGDYIGLIQIIKQLI